MRGHRVDLLTGRELPYIAPGSRRLPRAKLTQQLLRALPEGLEKFFFATSGTEAMKRPLRSRACIRVRQDHLALPRYHGSLYFFDLRGQRSAAMGGWNERQGSGHIFAPETNCYKCPIGHTYPSCNVACADYIEHMIRNESDVAAIIVEPIVGTMEYWSGPGYIRS